MRRWIIILGIVVLVVAAGVGLIVANLNSYLKDDENRAWLAGQAESAVGRSVSFGEVGVSLLGGLGVRVADLRIGDDPAFSKEPFVSADAIDLQVAILPALFGNIEVGHVVLRRPAITVIQTARGLSTDSLGGGDATAKPAEPAKPAKDEEGAEAGGLPAFVVANVDISDGTLRFINKTAAPAAETAIEQLDFRASNVSMTGPIGFELEAAVLGASRQNVRIAGQVVDLENPKADFTLTSDELELAPGEGGAPADALRDVELKGRLSLPKAGPHVEATVRSPRGTVAGADYADLAVDFKLQNQVATIEKFSMAAFDGELAVTGRYDMRNAKRPSFAVHSTLTAMRMEQIVASRSAGSAGSAESGKSSRTIEGELDGTLDLTGAGAEWDQIKRNLRGKGGVQLVDGVLKDVNLAESALKGITGVPGLSGLLPSELRTKYPDVFGTGDTAFENMDAKIDIRDGWAHFRDFRLAARDYAIAGQGRYSLDNRLDMTTVMTFSQPLSDSLVKAAKPMKYLRSAEGRVEFPVKLIGAPPDIKTVPDVAYIAKAASRQAVGKLLDDVLGGSKDDDEEDEGGESAKQPSAEDAATDLLKKGLGELLK
jgi:uncharacterized protein involved in outer membrane biogenesis